jgi:hypothetical protein
LKMNPYMKDIVNGMFLKYMSTSLLTLFRMIWGTDKLLKKVRRRNTCTKVS